MAISLDMRRSAALDPSTSSDELARLATDDDVVVRRRVATADGLDDASKALLANDVDPIVREKIARRTDLDPSIRAKLANDPRWNVREATQPVEQEELVGQSPVAADTLMSRAIDPNRKVRLDLACASAVLPDAVLEVLSRDDDALVRHAVASRELSLPANVAHQLMTDDEWPVRLAFAARRDLTDAQRAQLRNDPHDKVRTKVRS